MSYNGQAVVRHTTQRRLHDGSRGAALVLGNTNESPPAILSFSSFYTEREREREREMTFFQRGIFLFLFFLGLIVGLTTSQFRNRGRTEWKIDRGGVLWDILTSR